jgi:hypothetical protein
MVIKAVGRKQERSKLKKIKHGSYYIANKLLITCTINLMKIRFTIKGLITSITRTISLVRQKTHD